MENITGIEKINDFGQFQEIRISKNADSQEIISEIMKRTRVFRFEVTKPSLNDIFIRIASPEKTEKENA
jgi:ABC-2 type transport system ATP-binding protein